LFTCYRVAAGSQKPQFDSDGDSIIYFFTPQLANGTHTINVTVTTANDTNLFIIDYWLVAPLAGDTSGVATTRAAPSSSSSVPITTTNAVPVGAIVGGVVGGIAGIVVLVILVYYFLFRRSRGGQAYYFEKPGASDVLAAEGLSTFC
jgi:predicted PurR-regulated permease PerM